MNGVVHVDGQHKQLTHVKGQGHFKATRQGHSFTHINRLEIKHPAGGSINSSICQAISRSCLGFTMVMYEKIHLEA